MGNALFIIWRESAEAMLVVGILYAWLRKHPDMARGMRFLWGGVAAGVGLAIAAVIVAQWIGRGLGALSEERFAILAATLIIIGVQIFFSSFLLSILGLRRNS